MQKSISVAGNRCDKAQNNLVIIDNQPKTEENKKFGICTKQFTFEKREDTIKFVEWAEKMQILGQVHAFRRFFSRIRKKS